MQWTDRIGRRIKLQDLHVLIATVEAGSMGKAAQRMNTSQSAISRSIANLETTLGVALLARTPQGIEPTSFGRALIDTATSVFDGLRRGIQHIGLMSDPTASEIRIGGYEPMITWLLATVFDQLRAQYPSIGVHVKSITAVPQQYAELRERKVDLIVGRLSPPFDNDVEAVTLYQEETFVVGGAGNRWSRQRRPFALSELANEAWALPQPNTLVGALFAEGFRANGMDYPPKCVVTGNIHLHCVLVAGGKFLAILPGSVLRLYADRLRLHVLPVESPVSPAPVGILWLKDRAVTPAVQHFIACARESARSFI
jgi:DNA-binding transcriptional LysR family regulator